MPCTSALTLLQSIQLTGVLSWTRASTDCSTKVYLNSIFKGKHQNFPWQQAIKLFVKPAVGVQVPSSFPLTASLCTLPQITIFMPFFKLFVCCLTQSIQESYSIWDNQPSMSVKNTKIQSPTQQTTFFTRTEVDNYFGYFWEGRSFADVL